RAGRARRAARGRSAPTGCRRSPWSVVPSCDFEQRRGAHAAADAHRDDGMLHATAPSFDQGMSDEPRAAHAERMPDRDRAAVHVEPFLRNAEAVAAMEDLHGERLVELPEPDVVDAQAVTR